ncbi:hypothetical protein PsorP6_008168 [Peronosclerospora sorghi]|uniref:Uncharacterized protein n=1 Tax=Peronosclerospora sorghi TaxID=230839 RepID=A0ACC0W9J1_9STRA|nr:hypothetical protein PsorP6_008168 [Peronosclerospora sorghi]
MDIYGALAVTLMVLGLIVSSAGGLGGGVIMVPAMVLIMGIDIKRATPISNVAIFGGAVANAWFNMRKRHPTVDRPLIDPELALGMIPVVIGGAVLGAIINKLIPSYVLSLLFVVVLFVGGSRAMMKGIHLHKKELSKKKEAEGIVNEVVFDVQTSPITYVQMTTPQKDDVLCEKRESSSIGTTDEVESAAILVQILEKERHFAWGPHITIMVCYLGVVATSIGGVAVHCGGVVYWVLLLIEVPWIALVVVLTSRYLHKEYLRKLEVKYEFKEGDIRWTKKTVIYFPLGCAAAGIAAGMFGVGGGIITGPIMIELGVVPEVASSTTALMILYSSAAATTKYALFKMIAWDWALLLAAVAFVVTSASQVVILGYVRRTGRQSIIVLCIAVTVLLGGVVLTYQAIQSTVDNAGHPFSPNVCR